MSHSDSSSTFSMAPYATLSVARYERLQRLGEGTYGTVYRARDRDTGDIVALKKLRLQRERGGFPQTSVREIKLLRAISHPNIVKLKAIAVGRRPDSVFLVFEYCLGDYATLIDRRPRGFSIGEIKTILLQLLSAVDYLHSNFILHRDLKLSNLLFNQENQLKLADFGLARSFSSPLKEYNCGNMTPKVVTLWYRCPELLLGSEKYHSGVDLWAVGMIFAELLNNEPLLPGKTEPEQLDLICRLLGTPNEKIWPELQYLKPKNTELPQYSFNTLNERFPDLSEAGLNLLSRMLTYDPSKRISAAKAILHPFFAEVPGPVSIREIDHTMQGEDGTENRDGSRGKSGEERDSESELSEQEESEEETQNQPPNKAEAVAEDDGDTSSSSSTQQTQLAKRQKIESAADR